MRRRRRWSTNDDRLLRKFHAEGKSDPVIGYILGRERQIIRIHRKRLGLPAIGKGGSRGWKHPPEARCKFSESNRRRWQDPAYAEKHTERLRKIAQGRPITRPARGSDEHKLYRKFIRNLGLERARQEMGL